MDVYDIWQQMAQAETQGPPDPLSRVDQYLATPPAAPPAPQGLMELWNKYGKQAREGIGLPHWTQLGTGRDMPTAQPWSPETTLRARRNMGHSAPSALNEGAYMPEIQPQTPDPMPQIPNPGPGWPPEGQYSPEGRPAQPPAAPAPAGNPAIEAILQALGTKREPTDFGALMKSAGGGAGGSDLGARMNRHMEEYKRGYKPLEVPTQTPFDRSTLDKWLELAAPKEPEKRKWQDMLIDAGLGATIAAGKGMPKGWAGLNTVLGGAAQGFSTGRDEDKKEQREFKRAQMEYAGKRAGVEGDLEAARVRRSDTLDGLKLEVAKANQGDLFSMMKVNMETEKAMEESRRGNASLGNQKLQILMQAEMNKARIEQWDKGNNIRMLQVLTKAQGAGGKGPTVDAGGGAKIPISLLQPEQLARFALPNLVKQNKLSTHLPAPVYAQLDAQAKQSAIAEGRKHGILPGTPIWQRTYETTLTQLASAWLAQKNPEAEAVQRRIWSAYQVTPAALAGSRRALSEGVGFDPYDDDED